jgi:MYXO-CTERM domain-containing protein
MADFLRTERLDKVSRVALQLANINTAGVIAEMLDCSAGDVPGVALLTAIVLLLLTRLWRRKLS